MSKHTWPDTDPIDKSDPYWESNNNLNCNGVQYKKTEVSPGKWQWVKDEAAMQRMADRENKRRALFWALRSRLLTDEEMARVAEYGEYLNIESMVSYNAADKSRELNDALLQQYRFRLAASTAKATDTE